MRIVITGVPGTGKSSVAKALAKKMCYELVGINEVVKAKKLWKGKDEHGSLIVNVRELEKALKVHMAHSENFIAEGHLACEMKLPADIAIVLRTPPELLEKRLKKRKYPVKKMTENLLAEALDYCTVKAQLNYKDVREIVSDGSVRETLKKVEKALSDANAFKPGKIDWGMQLAELVGRSLSS